MRYEVRIKHISELPSHRRRIPIDAAASVTDECAREWLSITELAAMGIDLEEIFSEADCVASAGRQLPTASLDRLIPLLIRVRAGPVTLLYDGENGPPPRLIALRQALLDLLAEEDRACDTDDPSSPTCYLSRTDLGRHGFD